jgi:prepilin-type N-terminal cleavage/methylation domain-containing protein
MKSYGFSLVELLVVLALASVLIALVGPLGFQSVERVKTQSEVVAIQRWYNRMGHAAFIRGQSIAVKRQGDSRLVAYLGPEPFSQRNVERLDLVGAPVIVFSSAGIPSRDQISFTSSAGRVFELPLMGALSVRSAY